ncbi:hypothetical protein LCGC14_0761980 [marine sediment metagenome]|uniref:Transcriptional regulator n=1 Tax=marine sediment metagenome TaxID=412755 RepID=A0A0F9QKS0_9ZZZZ|nr:hypothetical protein [bacterium]
MPEDIDELKKFENLSEMETKVIKILEEHKGKALDFIEMVEVYYKWDHQEVGSIKKFLKIFSGRLALSYVLDRLVVKNRIKKMISKGKVFYYLE